MPERKSGISRNEAEELSFKLGTYFKPSHPINSKELFAGRKSQIREVVDAINQQGQHAVLYGDRGVGKTSLANMLLSKLTCPGTEVIAPKVNCMSDDDYSSLWRRVFERIVFIADRAELPLGEAAEDLLREYTGPLASEASPDEVWRILWELGQEYLVTIIIDEYDTLQDRATATMLSDTIKFLSDNSVPATIVLIGVSEAVENIVDNHRSVERCLSQVYMPRMQIEELETIVSNGLRGVGMSIQANPLREIAKLSKGLPHYPHLLGLYAGRVALDSGRVKVLDLDVEDAIAKAVKKTQATVQSDYSKAVTSSRKEARYAQVLLACVMAETDDLGWFYPRNVVEPLEKILAKPCKIEQFGRHLHAFCDEQRGPILKKDSDSARPRYRFIDPIIQPYILMRGLSDELITQADLKYIPEEGMLF